MGQFCLQQYLLSATTELRPDPKRSAVRSKGTRPWRGRRGTNTSPQRAESVARRPKVLRSLHRQTTKRAASQRAERRLSVAERAAMRPPVTRRWHESRLRSARWPATAAAGRWGLQAKKTFPADDPERPLPARRESLPLGGATAVTTARSEAQPLPVVPRKTRWRVLQSLPDRGVPTSRRKRPGISSYLLLARLLAWKTMSARRSLTDHLYS